MEQTKVGNQRLLLLALRQALLIALGAIETYLGLERTVLPKHLQQGNTA